MRVIGLRCVVLTWRARVRRQLGYPTGADARHYARLSGCDNLELFAELNSLPRNDASHRFADLTACLERGSSCTARRSHISR
jgi:ABC-type Na+ transport system ATPase subunit NatA